MTDMRRALVVGGGIGGMSTAIALGRIGVEVELIDLDPHWRVYGAGITITGPTLRAMRRLGLYDEVAAQAYVGEGIRICGVDGRLLYEVPTPMPPGAGVAGTGGILRPVLHALLSRRVAAAGTRVRLGLTVDALDEAPDGVEVRFSDGGMDRFDLVVGADGLNSRVRGLIFPDAPRPQYMGQSVWRTLAPRAAGLDHRHFFLGGPHKVGLTPVSSGQMYLFLLENRRENRMLPDAALPGELARLLADYGGPLADVRATLGSSSSIVVRPLEALRLPEPWSRGRVQLVGDAAHPTTPQLASGAGLAIEDAIVLAEELARPITVEAGLAAFMRRRAERCRMVVENSFAIGRKEQSGAPIQEQTELVARSLAALTAEI